MKNLPIQLRVLIYFVAVLTLWSVTSGVYNVTKDLYNSSKTYEYEYDKVVQEQITNYDGYYQAFMDKSVNANINKDVFIEVTNIIMSRRQDGANVAWKWLQENQQIPYQEFTYFYKELSAFINARYSDNMEIERRKQQIVRDHNLQLDTFPGNFINWWLKIKKMKYVPGYVTKETKKRFSN